MMCQECGKRPATVFITKIVNNHKEQIALCEECAKKYQQSWNFGVVPDFSIHKFLANLLQETEIDRSRGLETEVRCPNCGLTFSEFKETGKLGCGECYHTFDKALQPFIRRVQGTLQHGGKIPERIGGNLKVRQKLEKLKIKLQDAIRLEEFEEAARLRDEIREMEKKVK